MDALKGECAAAWAIAVGATPPDPASASIRICGAENDYNARGRGSTMARRVLRGGQWAWVSAPASRGRLRASDRHDATCGDVYVGEIVAQYTLGGSSTPDVWYLVYGSERPLHRLAATHRRDGRWDLTLDGAEGTVTVADPYWR